MRPQRIVVPTTTRSLPIVIRHFNARQRLRRYGIMNERAIFDSRFSYAQSNEYTFAAITAFLLVIAACCADFLQPPNRSAIGITWPTKWSTRKSSPPA